MSSVSGSSSVNGLYSNPNVISGLVSGLDTESMIEGLVDSYNQKIIGYQRDVVVEGWKQDAYRNVTTELQTFLNKYTSFTSTNTATNLFSNSLFSSCTNTTANGANSSAVTVSGNTDSTVTVDSVLQVATSTTLVSSQLSNYNDSETVECGSVNLNESFDVGTMSGNMTLAYGTSSVSISFGEDDVITNGKDLADLINEKLSDKTLNNEPANTSITAVWNSSTNSISFEDSAKTGTAVYMKSAGSGVSSALGITTSSSYSAAATTINCSDINFSDLTTSKTNMDYVNGSQIAVDFNGSKHYFTIDVDTDGLSESEYAQAIVDNLNDQMSEVFGTAVEVENLGNGSLGELQLNFTSSWTGTNSITVTASAKDKIGVEDGSISNNFTTSTKLSSIDSEAFDLGRTIDKSEYSSGTVTLGENEALFASSGGQIWNNTLGCMIDSDGDTVVEVNGGWYKLNDDGELRVGETMTINGVECGVYDSESTINDVLTNVNGSDCGVSLSFSSLTNNFVMSTSDVGSHSAITIENDGGLAQKLFGSTEVETDNDGYVIDPDTGDRVTDEGGNEIKNSNTYNQGVDSIVIATVNGEQVQLVRSSNTLDLEGLSVTINSTFNNTTEDGAITSLDDYAAAVTDGTLIDTGSIGFTEEVDVDPVYQAILQMVDDYNSMMDDLYELFTTVPLTTSSGSAYLPLTDEDSASMTDAAVATYEENAKTGLLYGDSNIRGLYNSLTSVFSASGTFGMDLYEMGFEVSYGYSTSGSVVDVDTDKLKTYLEGNLERARTVFTSNTGTGATNAGVMESLKGKMEDYCSVTGSPKGILVEAAGHENSPLSILSNTMQDRIDSFNELIKTWEEKLDNQITFYTTQFSKLEVLMSNANSQMSALSGLGGGY